MHVVYGIVLRFACWSGVVLLGGSVSFDVSFMLLYTHVLCGARIDG